MNNVEKLVDKLLAEVPEFREVHKTHIAFNDELLPYVLIGELADFSSDAYAKRKYSTVHRIIHFINEAVGSSDEIAGMIQVAFLMHLPRLNGYTEIRAMLNEKALTLLKEELREPITESEN